MKFEILQTTWKNARFIDKKLKTKSLMFFASFFHVICNISNFNMWTANHLAQASWTELTLQGPISFYYIKAFNLVTIYNLVTVLGELKSVTKSRLHYDYSIHHFHQNIGGRTSWAGKGLEKWDIKSWNTMKKKCRQVKIYQNCFVPIVCGVFGDYFQWSPEKITPFVFT